jgi:hypothetical protein
MLFNVTWPGVNSIHKDNKFTIDESGKRAMEWLTHSLYDYHRYKGSSSMEPPFFSAQCTTNDYSYTIVFHCDLLHREREDS